MSNRAETPPLVAAARDAAVPAAEHAAEADAERRLHPAVVEAIVDAGFARHFAPGETAGTFAELLEATDVLARACASAGWVASVTASAGRLTAHLPAAGREEVWQKGADTVVAAGLIPAGTAEPVPGGWRVDGRWPYVSGADFAHWVLVAARAGDAGTPGTVLVAVPRGDIAVQDTWFTLGMRGTGSNTVVVDGVFVPRDRSVPLDRVVAGEAPEPSAPCHRTPLKAGNGLTLAAPLLGAARGALRRWTELVGGRPGPAAGSVSGAVDQGAYEQVLSRCDGEIDAAGLLLARAARTADSGAPGPDVARNVRDCALAAELLTTAVDRLLHSAGTRGHAEGEELQRLWRDVTCGAGHNALRFPPAAQLHARSLLER
ncbi:acyl-CoA dehydrogenase family protein [Streptomyces macrosporus]|uniref:Actinorhodin polyketide dimerase ActVA n=1 Tax=Streptomyces macrosporus TaxID=44032 RepID=A0ABN3JHE8_9ACTN